MPLMFPPPIALVLLRHYQQRYDRYLRAKHKLCSQHDVVDVIEEMPYEGSILKTVCWTRIVVLEQALRVV